MGRGGHQGAGGNVGPLRDTSRLISWEQLGEGLERTMREQVSAGDSSLSEHDNPPLASSTRELLDFTASELIEALRDDLEAFQHGEEFSHLMTLADALPPCFAEHYTPELIQRFIDEIIPTASKLKGFPDTYLESTAQELAAHLLLNHAEMQIEVEEETRATTADESYPIMDNPPPVWFEERDRAYSELEDLRIDAFEDHDILILFDSHLEGLENSAVAEQVGGVNIHPQRWFQPFRD